jgi:hypothetical protein
MFYGWLKFRCNTVQVCAKRREGLLIAMPGARNDDARLRKRPQQLLRRFGSSLLYPGTLMPRRIRRNKYAEETLYFSACRGVPFLQFRQQRCSAVGILLTSLGTDFRQKFWEDWGGIRSRRRSTSQRPIVVVSIRSQMLYPVELRAPEKSGNLRTNSGAVKYSGENSNRFKYWYRLL